MEKKKKIAIITWHGGPNAGTFFQLNGLYTYLTKRGHHVEVIDYSNQPRDLLPRGAAYYLSQPIALIRRRLQRRRVAKQRVVAKYPFRDALALRDKRFEEMYAKIQLTPPVRTDEDFAALNSRFDTFVVGSDQTWNASMLNRRYLLDFVGKGKVKASYCPSMGTALVMKRQRQTFHKYLEDFNYISTREKALQQILAKELARNDVEHLLDPSMLVSREEYRAMARLPKEITPRSYVLCYFMPKDQRQVDLVHKFASARGLKVVVMAMSAYSFTIPQATIYASAGPREFVGLIDNAAVVMTSSFHCTIFSILLHKDLYVFGQKFTSKAADINQRYIEQLQSYGMSHRYIEWGKEITAANEAPIDYDRAETIFQERLKASYDFLSKFS